MDKTYLNPEEIYNQIIKTVPLEYSGDFKERLLAVLNDYYQLVLRLDRQYLYDAYGPDLNHVEGSIILIEKCISAFYRGDHKGAYETLTPMLECRDTISFSIPCGTSLYRMRKPDTSGSIPYEEMFHVPFNKRYLISTQRYSVPGYPCLYLGRTPYVCWEEMKKTDLSSLVCSRFVSLKDIKIYDLMFPSKDDWCNNLNHYMPLMPIILSCMVKVQHPDKPFKPEYIVPQLVTEYIITHQAEGSYLGIAYTSSEMPLRIDGSHYHLNVVIPAVKVDPEERILIPKLEDLPGVRLEGNKLYYTHDSVKSFMRPKVEKELCFNHCPILASLFLLTDGISCNIDGLESLDKSPSFSSHSWNETKAESNSSNYWVRLEDLLNDEEHIPLKQMSEASLKIFND